MIAALMAAAVAAAPIAYPSFPAGQGFTGVARWLEREAGAPRRDLVAVRDSFAWIMTPDARDVQAGRPVVLRLETLDAEAWRRLNGRSAIVRLDADCGARKATIRNADVYQGSNLLGGVSRNVEPSALPVLPDTLAAVADGLCRKGAEPPPVVAELAAPPPSVAAPAPAPVAPPEPRPTPSPPPPPPPPPVTRPQVVAAAQPSPPPPAPPVPPALPVRPAPAPAASAPAAPAATYPPAPALRPALAPTPPPPVAPETVVQIGAFGSTGAAMVALRELTTAQPKLMTGKLQRLEPIAVAGGQLHRALLTGFASVAEAEAFCRALVATGKPCVVRPSP